MKPLVRTFGRLAALLLVSLLAWQLSMLARVSLMRWVDPQSTAFQRSEAWRLLTEQGRILWRQEWVGYEHISPHLKRAVIASEDANFFDHSGVEWESIEKAWERNQRAEAQAERLNAQIDRRETRRSALLSELNASGTRDNPARPLKRPEARIVGGSTITQQLAKNLLLSSERSVVRKAQEFIITLMLEALLSKQRILEIYLNNVEWGEGVFGAQAAAHHYFHADAAQLGPQAAARLAVMLPAPKRFEKRPTSAYVSGRAATIVARMGAVEIP